MSIDAAVSEISVRPAWKLGDAELIADTKSFWQRWTRLESSEIDRRVSELCAAAYLDGGVVGVSTAYFEGLEILRGRFAMFRCMIEPGRDQTGIASRLAMLSREQLERWSLANPNERILGMAAVIPVGMYRERWREPVWADEGLNLNLVSYLRSGEQVRVSWFGHARIGEASPAHSVH